MERGSDPNLLCNGQSALSLAVITANDEVRKVVTPIYEIYATCKRSWASQCLTDFDFPFLLGHVIIIKLSENKTRFDIKLWSRIFSLLASASTVRAHSKSRKTTATSQTAD